MSANLTAQRSDNRVPFEYDLVIITPSYNRPDLLSRLHLDLVESCRDIMWMHIVVDDASKVNYVLDQVFKGSKRFLYERRSSNGGALAARNRGLNLAETLSCEFIAFVDDDDRVIGQWKNVLEMVRGLPDRGGWYFCLDQNTAGTELLVPSPGDAVFNYIEDFHIEPKVRQDATHIFESGLVRGLRFDESFRVNREWTYFLRLASRQNRLHFVKAALVNFEYQSDGLSLTLRRRGPTWAGILDSLQKSIWLVRIRPDSSVLWSRLLRQLAFFLPKCASLVFITIRRVVERRGH